MKTQRFTLILFLALATTIWGCKKREGNLVQTATVKINVSYPETYSLKPAANTEVKLTNKGNGSVVSGFTNATGVATFSDVIPGTYDISVNKSLSAAESLTLTGVSQAIVLNAAKSDAVVSAPQSPEITLQLSGSVAGNLVIKEVYYTGSKTPAGGTYFSDQFVELYNNSTEVIYLDGLCIADIYGNAGLINPSSLPTAFNTDNTSSYAGNVWRIPGTGKQRPLAPGESIIIAQDGVNHREATLNPNSPVDLSKADWETYNERPDNRDADAPGVPNLEKLYFTGGFDWLLSVFGPSLVIFRTDDFSKLTLSNIPGSTSATTYVKIPNALVIDSFQALKDASSGSFKRLPVAIDAGFVFATDTYTGESFRRKISTTINGRRVLQDTNNSGEDFQKLSTPTPRGF
ncbi:DUF4876 domain-containing protein [Pedobacter namyangjuensis]|uniref:DUF4876 domain-containing protein n=1 Tax=Pedobacter namyangjuensis TaxID=600626 RepID=UPI000DE33380|nr:DUF4876 domain-containing protein [Pedobacter namyangjuensis]